MSMKRFRVQGHSMLPTLEPGTEVVASSTLEITPGQLVTFPHPDRPDMWLIKRLADLDGRVVSDNQADSSADTAELGPIDVSSMLAVVERLDENLFFEGCQLLASEDHAMNRIVDRWGVPDFWAREPGFQTLTLLILEQQVSLESGAAMFRRLADLTSDVTPAAVVMAGEPGLRSIGVTRQKSAYLTGLAEMILDGTLDLDSVSTANVDEARKILMAVKGIGAWTADAYLLSALRRPDMWPVGDRALQVGAGEVLGMKSAPDEAELEIVGDAWRPLRAVAARLIWHSYLCERGRVEPPDPTV